MAGGAGSFSSWNSEKRTSGWRRSCLQLIVNTGRLTSVSNVDFTNSVTTSESQLPPLRNTFQTSSTLTKEWDSRWERWSVVGTRLDQQCTMSIRMVLDWREICSRSVRDQRSLTVCWIKGIDGIWPMRRLRSSEGGASTLRVTGMRSQETLATFIESQSTSRFSFASRLPGYWRHLWFRFLQGWMEIRKLPFLFLFIVLLFRKNQRILTCCNFLLCRSRMSTSTKCVSRPLIFSTLSRSLWLMRFKTTFSLADYDRDFKPAQYSTPTPAAPPPVAAWFG